MNKKHGLKLVKSMKYTKRNYYTFFMWKTLIVLFKPKIPTYIIASKRIPKIITNEWNFQPKKNKARYVRSKEINIIMSH